MKIHYSSKIAHCPAFTATLCAYADLLKNGHGNPKFEYGNQSQVVYVTDDEETIVLGANVFVLTPDNEGVFLFSFAHPDHRRKGLYTLMAEEVEKHLLKQGAQVITYGTWLDNAPMREVTKSMGTDEVSVRSAKWLSKQLK